MKLTKKDLYTVVQARGAQARTKRESLGLLGVGVVSLIVMVAAGPSGLLVAVVLLLGWTVWFLRKERRSAKSDREEAARLYTELPTAMRAEAQESP